MLLGVRVRLLVRKPGLVAEPLHTLCPLTTGGVVSYPIIRSEQHIKLWFKLPLKSKESQEALCLLCSIWNTVQQLCLTCGTTWYPSAPLRTSLIQQPLDFWGLSPNSLACMCFINVPKVLIASHFLDPISIMPSV